MKLLGVGLLAAQLLAVSGASLRPRQEGSAGGAGSQMEEAMKQPPFKTWKIEELEPTFKGPDVKRAKLYYGPYSILGKNEPKKQKPYSMDPDGTAWVGMLGDFPKDVTILSTVSAVVYADGKRADISNGGIYNHHVTLADITKPPTLLLSCPGKDAAPLLPISVFAGVGEDQGRYQYTTPNMSLPGGFYIGKNDQIFTTNEIVNYSDQTKDVYAMIDVEYYPGKKQGDLDITSETLSVAQCDGSTNAAIKPPEGEKVWSVKSPEFTVHEDGYIFAQRGHLHDGGVNVPLKLNGKVVCDSKAVYGGASATMQMDDHGSMPGMESGNQTQWETVSSMTPCMDPIRVKSGDKIGLDANYDFVAHPAREHPMGGMAEEMGLMIFSFAAVAPNSTVTVRSEPEKATTSSGNSLLPSFLSTMLVLPAILASII